MRKLNVQTILVAIAVLASACSASSGPPDSLSLADEASATTTTVAPDPTAELCGPNYKTRGTTEIDGQTVAVVVDNSSRFGMSDLTDAVGAPELVACVNTTSEGASMQSCGFYNDEEGRPIFIQSTMLGLDYETRLISATGEPRSAQAGVMYSECAEDLTYTQFGNSALGQPTLTDQLAQETSMSNEQGAQLVTDAVGWASFQDPTTPLAADVCQHLGFLDDYMAFYTAIGADANWSDIPTAIAALADDSITSDMVDASSGAAAAMDSFEDGSFVSEKLLDMTVVGVVGWDIVSTDVVETTAADVALSLRTESFGALMTGEPGFAHQVVTTEQLQLARQNRC